jgi:hypothetical protein
MQLIHVYVYIYIYIYSGRSTGPQYRRRKNYFPFFPAPLTPVYNVDARLGDDAFNLFVLYCGFVINIVNGGGKGAGQKGEVIFPSTVGGFRFSFVCSGSRGWKCLSLDSG